MKDPFFLIIIPFDYVKEGSSLRSYQIIRFHKWLHLFIEQHVCVSVLIGQLLSPRYECFFYFVNPIHFVHCFDHHLQKMRLFSYHMGIDIKIKKNKLFFVGILIIKFRPGDLWCLLFELKTTTIWSHLMMMKLNVLMIMINIYHFTGQIK